MKYMKGRMNAPMHIVERVMSELEPSVQDILLRSSALHLQGRMQASDIEALMRSVAWQSPTMQEYLAWQQAEGKEGKQETQETPELLSAEDMAQLLGGTTLSS